MENQDANRGGGSTDPVGHDMLGNAASLTSNHMPYDNNNQHRDPPQFQHLISNDHTQLPPNPQFGMGHHFVTPFPGYMHAVPSGLYSLNMIDDTEHHPKRRRRTNYRDPENAAKLTTALGILIKQKEENKPQDLKSIASHFGLPYNTLRDNYLKVTTGKLVRDKGEKKEETSDRPRQKRSANTSGHSSRTTSCATTPRDPAGASTPSASSSMMSHPMGTMSYGSMAMPGSQNGATAFGAYPMYHPQMGLHYMPQMAMPSNMPHMQNMQMQSGTMGAPGMHSMLNGAPPMMHIFTTAPMGYQVNPATGRPYPVFAQPGGDLQQMQHQMQQQMQNAHAMSTQHQQQHQSQSQPQQQQQQQIAQGGVTSGESSTAPTTPHTPHMLVPPMYVSAMPGTMPSMPGTGTQQAMSMPLPMPMPLPMFHPAAYAPHLGDSASSAPSAGSTGFSLLLPGPTYTSPTGGATTPSNSAFLAAAMSAAYGEIVNNGANVNAQGQNQHQGMGSSGNAGSSSSGASGHVGAGSLQSASTTAASQVSANSERSSDAPERDGSEQPAGSSNGGSEDGGEGKASQTSAGNKREHR